MSTLSGEVHQEDYSNAYGIFNSLSGYKDSDAKAEEAWKKVEEDRLENSYQLALEKMDSYYYEDAATGFEALGDYKDSKIKAEEARAKIPTYYEVGFGTQADDGKNLGIYIQYAVNIDGKCVTSIRLETKEIKGNYISTSYGSSMVAFSAPLVGDSFEEEFNVGVANGVLGEEQVTGTITYNNKEYEFVAKIDGLEPCPDCAKKPSSDCPTCHGYHTVIKY
jgi:hypothetical protein